MAVILNYLFEIPMGITIFCVNIPLLLLAWRFLGHEFTLHSLKTILVWSVLVDVVAPYLPAYAGDKILAALFGGVCIGIAVALVFLAGFHHRRNRYREPAAAAALALYAHRQDDDRGGRGDCGGFDGGL